MNKHIILLYTTAFLLFSSVWNTLAADKTSPREGWITGEVFVRNGVLFFRTDQPVQGNTKGNVVLLGATKQAAATLLPAYMRAAEKHLKLRLYGSLLPFSGSMPGYSERYLAFSSSLGRFTYQVTQMSFLLTRKSSFDESPSGNCSPVRNSTSYAQTSLHPKLDAGCPFANKENNFDLLEAA